MENITLTNDEVITVLSNLNNNKSHGPDGIPARLLTETSCQIAASLSALFNKSTLWCSSWWLEISDIVLVHKRDGKSYVENYRPISLLPLISKDLERCVFQNIQHHVYQQVTVINTFLFYKNLASQLVEIFEQIGRKLDSGKQRDVINLGISKALDKVSHAQLLRRLREFGFRGNLLNWFSSCHRYQQTAVDGVTSRLLPVTSGVPQSSLLGPLLFPLYENYLSESLRNCSIADDTKIFKAIHNVCDASLLQEDQTHFEDNSSKVNVIL